MEMDIISENSFDLMDTRARNAEKMGETFGSFKGRRERGEERRTGTIIKRNHFSDSFFFGL